MRICLFYLLLCFSLCIQAQDTQRAVLSITPEQFNQSPSLIFDAHGAIFASFGSQGLQTDWIEIPIEAQPFLAFSIAWKYSGTQPLMLYYQFEEEDKDWQLLKADSHYQSQDGRQVSTLIFKEQENRRLKLALIGNTGEEDKLENLDLHFYSPGISVPKKMNTQEVLQSTAACPCPQPEILNRQEWCPTNDCAEHPNPQQTTVTHLIVHHAAGTNASSNWSGVVRSIWDYHVNTNGWDDIGYNWLIDPNGLVYEGRGDNIQGAHFCGNNGGTAGICMLGNFNLVAPSTAALDQLKQMLSWKACDINIDPIAMTFHASSNKTLANISGHKDGCNTECPGDLFYPLFANLRNEVKNYQDAECSEFLAPSNLTAWATSETNIQLQWKDNSGTETAFLLERSKNSNENYTEIAQIPANTNYYTDTNLTPFRSYFYRVRATNDFENTDYSNEYGAATILTSNQNLQLENTNIQINPNPSSGPIQLSLQGDYLGEVQLTLVDIQGRQLEEWTFNKLSTMWKENLDFEKKNTGIFVLQIRMGDQKGLVKILRN